MSPTIRPQVPCSKGPNRSRDPTSNDGCSMGNQSIGIPNNGIDTIPMQYIHNGVQW